MQNWEYLEIAIDKENWQDSMGRKGKFSDRMIGSYGTVFYNSASLLNELGAQGWELTGVAGGAGGYGHKLFLKRPRA